MAGELAFTLPGLTGSTLYAVIRRASDGAVWDTGTSAWEAWDDASYADYDVALTEQGTGSGRWLGDKPAGVTVAYGYEVCKRVGGSPAKTDPVVGVGDDTRTALVSTDTTVGTIAADMTTLLGRLSAARAGYLDNLSAGAVATAAKLLSLFQSALRNDVTVDADIGGTYSDATHSQQALAAASAPSAETIADAVWDEAIAGHLTAGSTGNKLNGAGGAAGSGAITYTYTVTNSDDGLPIAGVAVWVTTDSAGSNVVAGTLTTDSFGVVTFYLDAGTYYIWRQLAGWTFTNPDTEVVS